MDVRIHYAKLGDGLYISQEYWSIKTLSLYHVVISLTDGLVSLKNDRGETIITGRSRSMQRSRRVARRLLKNAGVIFGEEVRKKIGDQDEP